MLETRYEEYKHKNNIKKDRVHILYNIPRKDISTYVKKSKIYFMTSKWEAFPISLVECMASKVPFISTNVGIIRYLPGGVVCETNDDFIFWLNEFTKNEEKRKEYGNLGYIEAKRKFSINEKVNQLEELIKKAVKQ